MYVYIIRLYAILTSYVTEEMSSEVFTKKKSDDFLDRVLFLQVSSTIFIEYNFSMNELQQFEFILFRFKVFAAFSIY